MKQLYFECNMGAAGDMLMGALYDICPDQAAFLEKMTSLHIPGVHIHAHQTKKMGITGISMDVHIHGQTENSTDVPTGTNAHHHGPDHTHTHHHNGHTHHGHADHTHTHEKEHAHGSMKDIRTFIEKADLPEQIKADALSVYKIIADAEAAVHGTTVEHVHFHEVGTLDALADILGCCILMNMISPDQVISSPVHVGSGQVRCAHGILPVPAPATAKILVGVPIYSGAIEGELCTPTGAALLKHFVHQFGAMPAMTLENTGYGFGKKDFAAANCVRAMMGVTGGSATEILELSCNMDDMSGEALGVTLDILMGNGALDAFFTPIQMKKNRPAVMLTCLCTPDLQETLTTLMLKHTATLGVRKTQCMRTVLAWDITKKQTPFGMIRVKQSHGYGIKKIKPEFDDVQAAAEKHGVSFDTVYYAAIQTFAVK